MPGVGRSPAGFTATTTDDEQITLEMLTDGQLIGFLSPGCRPCREKAPQFAAQAAAGERTQALAVVIGARTGPPSWSPSSSRWPGWSSSPALIKRVAAVPGDRPPREAAPALANHPEPLVLPGHLVAFGDDHRHSPDSKQIGYFPADRLVGVVTIRRAAGNASGHSGSGGPRSGSAHRLAEVAGHGLDNRR